MSTQGVYKQILERLFFSHYEEGVREIPFDIESLLRTVEVLGVQRSRNPPDVTYSMRYRGNAPDSIIATEPDGESWVIRGRGRGL